MDEKQQVVIKYKYFIYLLNIPVHVIRKIIKGKQSHEVKMKLERNLMVCISYFSFSCCHWFYLLIGIINELKNADDLESTFRQIAKDKSDCSSGQRGGKFIDLLFYSKMICFYSRWSWYVWSWCNAETIRRRFLRLKCWWNEQSGRFRFWSTCYFTNCLNANNNKKTEFLFH